MSNRRVIVAISGASGAIYGIRVLEFLRAAPDIETHLILTPTARATIREETDYRVNEVEALADVLHSSGSLGACIASGSFRTAGMIVAPCSIKSLSAIANSLDSDLLTRAADVQLKEGRPVLLLVRETPLHVGHLRLMVQAAEAGAIIMPPVPAFYGRPKTIDDLVNTTVGRALARLGIENELFDEWEGLARSRSAEPSGSSSRSSEPTCGTDAVRSDGIENRSENRNGPPRQAGGHDHPGESVSPSHSIEK